ncbi:MAG: glycine betaine ABC transporter substrate-binding protein [Salinivenus sp.]
MTHRLTPFRTLVTAVVLALVGVGLAGCGGGSSGDEGPSRQMQMVTVNWIEGMAMTYMQEAILEDSLDMEVEVNEVQGGGIAFSSVAQGDADFFNEAWLPTTHQDPWEKNQDNSQKLGYTYKGTSVGIAVPSYVEVDTFPDFADYQSELDGTINGIESGAAINGQIRNTIEMYNMGDQFSVTAASGPANWQALGGAIENNNAIAVAAWKPHWKWNDYDIKYVNGARTGDNTEIWGQPEDIFTIVDNEFIDEFPKEVVCFLKEFEANDQQVGSLMNAFRNRGDMSKREAAQQWIQEHPDDVNQWMQQTRECAASSEPVEPLPDDATFSSSQSS